MNPIDIGKYIWDSIEAAWERDVVNDDVRSTAKFFSYGLVSIFALKGLDKIGKAGSLGKVGF
ncbi:hypothetical protein [Bacillus sp. T33-2]|uniref:hypothetical protein n=1 Tax=Bacillus sp. T33-2 TaxID=2054168 RepID=UPI000C7885B9|nr:hypothetical protein [Bacillus sp. T33-2]PLR94614.1 hypothetical protein CVD19_16725 [Bacillus sp. T33-2]